jgi:hypothetical protein
MNIQNTRSVGEFQVQQFREVVRALHSRDSKLKMTGVFKAYLDESYDGRKEKLYLIAGWLGSLATWEGIIPQWLDALEQAGVSTFHMTDCAARKGEFRDLSESESERLILRLVKIVEQADIQGFWYAMLMRDYDAIIKDNPTARKVPWLNDPHCMTFGACIQEIALAMQQYPASEKVMFIFDYLTKLGARTIQYYNEVNELPVFGGRMHHTMAISKKTEVIPLQVVDLLAWEMRRDVENVLGLSQYPVRGELLVLKRKLASGCGYLDRDHLKRLSNFLASEGAKPTSVASS